MTDPVPVPTQVKRPWRATLRTAFQAFVAFAGLAPLIAAGIEESTGYDLDGVPFVVTALLLCAAFTRVMTLQAVEAFLQTFVPFLSAAPAGNRILGKAFAGGVFSKADEGQRREDGDPHR